MNITVEEIEVEDNDLLEKMVQLYLHDISKYFKIDFDSTKCEYEYDISSYFIFNKAYFIKSDDNILGFILLDINSNDDFEISEIFVLNNYKNNKVGTKAIRLIFDMYKGKFIIKVVPNSKKAEKFWENTVKDYTNNNYEIEHNGEENRIILSFVTNN